MSAARVFLYVIFVKTTFIRKKGKTFELKIAKRGTKITNHFSRYSNISIKRYSATWFVVDPVKLVGLIKFFELYNLKII